MPNAPSSIARRTTARIVSSSAAFGLPIASPFAYTRTVAAPMNEPTLGDVPCACIASSHAPKPCGPGYAPVPRGPPVANWPPAAVFSFVGAGVPPSPRISVVMPCVTLLTDRPSPRKFVPLWMSMNPGETTRPRSVDALLRRKAAERPGRSDARDAVADDGDVAEEPRGAGSVDHVAVLEHEVEGRLRTGRGGRRMSGARGERQAGDEN